jgi:beta-lactamase regulating signal transducer with metallopeptidase domain
MQSFMIALLGCTVTMTILALFYMAITPFMSKRYSERGRYYAWLIIVIGLIIPFRPQFYNAIVQINIPSGTTTPSMPSVPAPVDFIPPVENTAFSPAWWQIAAVIWLAGVMAFVTYHAIKHYRFIKMAKRWSESVTDERTLALLQSLKAEMGISKRVSLYQCLSMGSPVMLGFVNPRILLPSAEMADDELRFILKHELVHYKRKDLYYKFLVLAATAIHWFNPLVYLIARAIYAQCEQSCDAEVVRNTDADTRQQYSEAIIGVVKYHSKQKTALSTNFYGGKKSMKNRISSIMDTRNKRLGITIIFIMLAVTMGTGFAFAVNGAVPDNNNSGRELQGAGSTFTDENGNNGSVADGQVGQTGRLTPNNDGTYTLAPNDDFPNGLNIVNPFSFGDGAILGGDVTVDFNAGHNLEREDIALPTYTEEEMAQIRADIESGQTQPAGIIHPDGTMEWFNRHEIIPEDAEIDWSFTPFD